MSQCHDDAGDKCYDSGEKRYERVGFLCILLRVGGVVEIEPQIEIKPRKPCLKIKRCSRRAVPLILRRTMLSTKLCDSSFSEVLTLLYREIK